MCAPCVASGVRCMTAEQRNLSARALASQGALPGKYYIRGAWERGLIDRAIDEYQSKTPTISFWGDVQWSVFFLHGVLGKSRIPSTRGDVLMPKMPFSMFFPKFGSRCPGLLVVVASEAPSQLSLLGGGWGAPLTPCPLH